MSEQVVSQKVQRVCDGCNKEVFYEMVDAPQEQNVEMASWYEIHHTVVDYEAGQFIKLKVQACCLACVPTATVKIAVLPTRPEDSEPSIDLNSLRSKNIN